MKEKTRAQPHAAGARVLLVDNFSSFTFNLYQYLAEVTGRAPSVVTNAHSQPMDLSEFDAVVLSPGPGTPKRSSDFGISEAMLKQGEVPVLGVCLGHQGLGLAAGAQLAAASELFHGRASRIAHQGDPLFEGIPKEFQAIRYHSLLLQDPLPESLACIARSEDGAIMAIAHKAKPQWGVQFHPESVETEHGRRLLANFCALSMRVKERPKRAPSQGEVLNTKPTRDSKEWQLHTRKLRSPLDAECVYATLYGESTESFWLDGGAANGHSYMGDCDTSYRIVYDQAENVAKFCGAKTGSQPCTSIFAFLQRELEVARVSAPEGYAFRFVGGFVGYFGYELRGDLGSPVSHPSELPDAHWIWAERFIAFDHASGLATLCALAPHGDSGAEVQAWFREVEAKLATPMAVSELPKSGTAVVAEPRDSEREYLAKIDRAQECIALGESYELCLTTELRASLSVHATRLYRAMRRDNPAPYSALLHCGDFALASASPERFLLIDASGWVQSKPIKGTAPRHADDLEDRRLAQALGQSVKDRAENLMIVDLVRNDLGRNCEVGSVVVESLAAVESYASVHQLVSTIGGQLRRDVHPLECVRDAFPAGSMTGAPKLRSMDILGELEGGPRGPYAGALGFLGCDGAVDLSVVIRTVVVRDGEVRMGVGGAITALSDPNAELDEMRLKGLAQRQALGVALQPS